MSDTPESILKQYWGFDSFRPMQREIIQSVLDARDTLALLPTGGGKSICFQVPALVQEGICIVISPLIALMKDQVYNLAKRGIPATAIFSGLSYREIDRILDNCVFGKYKFLYLSPERLVTELAIERIKKMKVNIIAIDEAHCISQWGYDFRPPYLNIADIRTFHPKVPMIALTATATADVVVDIQKKLTFAKQQVFQQSFKRDNLVYAVLNQEGKIGKLTEIIKKVKGSAVIYTRSRRRTKEIAVELSRRGVSAHYYHAGLDQEERAARQEAWLQDKTRVIVATNAFGMGIDKADVRLVVHMDVPDNLEAYFQEAGRAGRDGERAYSILLYNENDKQKLEKQFEQSYPALETIKAVYQALGSYFQLAIGSGFEKGFDFDLGDFCKRFGFNQVQSHHALKVLEYSGWLNISDAVFVPASMRFIVNRELLYDFQIKNPKLDILIRELLRNYQGISNNYVPLRNLHYLARALKMTPDQMEEQLVQLHKAKIVAYRAKKEKPQLFFLQERVAINDLTIDMEMYRFRKERQAFRLKKVLEYCEKPICRSQQLLAYFGESQSERCGYCDVCSGRTEAGISKLDYEKYKEKIKSLLRLESLSLEEITDSFAPKRHEKMLKTLEYLIEEGFLSQYENKKYFWKKSEK